jgi:selenide,water dikinase
LPIKPMQTFFERLDARLAALRGTTDRAARLAIVGGGVAGVEIAFCLATRLSKVLHDDSWSIVLVTSDDEVASGTLPKTRAALRRALSERGIEVRTGCRVVRATEGQLVFDNDEVLSIDMALWATSARAAPLLETFALPKDDRGFLLTEPTLQTTLGAPIFAVGDCGTIEGHVLPKAGVYAVREGPVLWENIQRMLVGEPLERYRPQTSFLKLINTGNGRAVAEYKGLTFHNRLCWKLKDRIDGRFMDMYQDYAPMPVAPDVEAASTPRCAGCGGKVGGSVLSRVLARLEIPQHSQVELGLAEADDAAIVRANEGRPLVVTTDFFAAPLDDPYVVGRVAALNAASDLFAMGARPVAALAHIGIPVGKPRRQEELLYELLAGGLREFETMGATLAGGHTIESPQITIGFTMLGNAGDGPSTTKARLKPGDVLILTKPLGTGVLLAAQMQARCRGEWMRTLVESMLQSNEQAASIAAECGVAAMTDVTGFGLAGHLLEMLEASEAACELCCDRIPLLPGVSELLHEGVESTLAPANRAAEEAISVPPHVQTSPAYQALFDPQTSGGLLMASAEANARKLAGRLTTANAACAVVIGRVTRPPAGRPQIRIV